MRWVGRRASTNVEDRRGTDGGLSGGFGGPRMSMGGGGGLGIGAVAVILIIGWIAGANPIDLLSQMSGGAPVSQTGGQTSGKVGAPGDEAGQFVATVLADTEATWKEIFAAAGESYEEPTLVIFDGGTQSACGFAQSASGPFYCPGDRKVYVDLAFYRELSERFDAPGDFAEAYVIAHEIGHHVQNLIGTLPKVEAQRRQVSETESNQLSVRTELQADCYAGIWAHDEEKRGFLDVGDIDEALNAAAQVGDDSIQQRTTGHVVPESFNHGSAVQRSRWFKRGYNQGTLDACDTFTPDQV